MATEYSERPNKRKSLNDIFKKVKNFIDDEFVYVTLGSYKIEDVNDLSEVFPKEQIKKIIVYEKSPKKAEHSRHCEVANEFSDRIKIINDSFPNKLEKEFEGLKDFKKIIFYDGEEWFCDKKNSNIRTKFEELFQNYTISHGDILMITSAISTRSWHTIEKQCKQFYDFCSTEKINNLKYSTEKFNELLMDNLVDLNVEVAITNTNKVFKDVGFKTRVTAERIRKIRYNDTHHQDMVLICFRILTNIIPPEHLLIPYNNDKHYRGRVDTDNFFDRNIG